jgi:diacylglycerol kinase
LNPELDREKYRPQANPDRFSSFKSSIAGLAFMLRYEKSIRLLSAYTLLVLAVALWLEVGALALVELILGIGAVWVTECLNTAIEATVDLAMPDLHPLAKIAKDTAGAATFLSASLSLLVTLVILVPPLLHKLSI